VAIHGALAGIGLRAPHYEALSARRPEAGFLEVHAENFFGEGGPALAWLERFRAAYELSIHGVGLSLGSAAGLDPLHLDRLARLAERFQPCLVSEHLSWSAASGRHANDLLPLPFTREAVDHVARNIERAQDRLKRRLLVENVSAYVAWPEGEMDEAAFLREVAGRSGCGILLDLNNVWVNAVNFGFDPHRYLASIEPRHVHQYHLAGHEAVDGLLVDTHGTPVCEEVWSLYGEALEVIGPRPVLVEWDTALPPLDVLLEHARRAAAMGIPAGHSALA
jgi:uncharacterized protein (UPF0276 family)